MTVPATIVSTLLGAINRYILFTWHFPGSDFIFAAVTIGVFLPGQMVHLPRSFALGKLGATNTLEELMLPLIGAANLQPGRKLVVGLRLEHFSRANGGSEPQLPVRVEVVEPTGAETIVVLKLGNHGITVRLDPDSVPDEGGLINLAVAACLIDPETEVWL